MNKLLLTVIVLVIVLLLTTNREPFTEIFGFSGYTKPTGSIKLDDARPDFTGYIQAEADVDNNMMEEFVLQTNREISRRTGLCTYIIETTELKKYTNNKNDKEIYECVFMVVKNSGFAYGFSVVASFEVVDGIATLMSLRSQPLDVQTVSDVSPFVDGQAGQEFVNYDLVKEKAVPTVGELEMTKNKLQ